MLRIWNDQKNGFISTREIRDLLKNLLDSHILYLSNYINKNKDEYYKLFTEFRENNNYEDWIIYILKGIEETSKIRFIILWSIY